MAKRSLAFTVATGGLLLTGTGYAPADTAVGPAVSPGQAQAQGNDASQASPSSVSTPINVREAQAPARASKARTPQRPHSDGGASATSTVKRSGGVLSGNTIQIPIDLGLNLCGNQAAVAGVANHDGGSTCSSSSGATADASTDRSGGVVSGNTIQAPVNVPLNVCGNQAVIAGVLNTVTGSKCTTGGGHGQGDRHPGGSGGANATAQTHHSGGVLSGNIVQAPINAPVNACGNQAVVGGVGNFTGGSRCSNGGHGSGSPSGANAVGAVSGSGGVLSGNILQAPVDAPVNLCGNGVEAVAAQNAVGGSKCSTNGGKGRGGAHATAATVNSGGLLSGNVAQAPVNAPVNVCGNQVNAVAVGDRDHHTVCSTKGGGATATSATVGSGGVASGNSIQTPINVPVTVCGNQVDAVAAGNRTGETVCAGGASHATSTSVAIHSGGVASGNSVNVPIDVPVNVCGNQVTAVGVGDDTGPAECSQEMTPPREEHGHHPHPRPYPHPHPHPYPHHHRHHHHPGMPSPSPSTSSSMTPSPSPSCSNTTSGSPSPSPSTSTSSSTTSSPSPSTSESTPPKTWSPSPGMSFPPHRRPTTPPPGTETPGPQTGGSLAHTGTDAAMLLGVAGAAVLGGLGLRTASRRRTSKH
ncbi:MAG TPA: chaplin [Actinocrinis sp.]|nr:chaplin [Actinocrinis sp.]